MLTITVPGTESFNEETNEFIYGEETTIRLEHSLVSISKWEAKWHLPFLHTTLTTEQAVDYVKCMTITQNVPDDVYLRLSNENIEQINSYLHDPMTATWFSDKTNMPGGPRQSRKVTAELIYYWMIALQMPVEKFEKWHLNRLLTLIKVCEIESQPKKKMTKAEIMAQNRALNESRKAALGTRG